MVTDPPNDVSELFDAYYQTLRSVVDKHVPAEMMIKRQPLSSPWFNHRCRVAKVVMRRLERRYRTTHHGDDLRLWRAQSDFQRVVFQVEYVSFWSRSFDSCPNSKSLWKKMNNIINSMTSASTSHSASEFNNFLTGKFDAIRAATRRQRRVISSTVMVHISTVLASCQSKR